MLTWFYFSHDLPSIEQLRNYESPMPSIIRDVEGTPVHSYARERRGQLEYDEYPRLLVHAFLAAEDRTFFAHGGIDYPGIASAIITNLRSDGRLVGASTITQQIAKNLLLSREVSYTRKIRESILAMRIENTLSKEQILELYLNEIPLGRRSFGVQAAAFAYFNKEVDQLKLHEMAFLAVLPKAPETYSRKRHAERAKKRRNYILGQMQSNGWITIAQRNAANAMPLGIATMRSAAAPQIGGYYSQVGGYYMEEVRRQLIDLFGESSKNANQHSVYDGGLWVRTPYDHHMQQATTRALRAGLLRYDAPRGWAGPIATIAIDNQWQRRLQSLFIGIDYEDWRIAVLLSKKSRQARIGFADGSIGILPAAAAQMRYRRTRAFAAIRPGDIIAVKPDLNRGTYMLRNIPEISGGMVVQNPLSGRVYAMQGGFDFRLSSFNRATQAERQPGSTIKPFVYATALDHGMTPASLIVDGPFCVYQGSILGEKCFRNFGNDGGAGEQTMRWGLEQSRNLMTVKTANQIGIEPIVETIRKMGIGEHPGYLSTALGAGSTTVQRIVNAYAIMVNHGRKLSPRLIDYVQDRHGRVIFPAQWKACKGCNLPDWDQKPMPRFGPSGEQVMDPMTAFQTIHMLQGVVLRGTARRLRGLDIPLFGKTGTTNGPKDVWFVGGTPDLVAGVYLGFDKPRNMGSHAQGSSLAIPVFKQFIQSVLPNHQPMPFLAPRGIRMVRIDRRSGRRVYSDWPSSNPSATLIWEAFKPNSEPRRSINDEHIEESDVRLGSAPRAEGHQRSDSEFMEDRGGII